VQTLMDAGLTPVHGKANHMDTSDPPQTVLQNLHNDNVSTQISACAQPLPAVWRDRGPVESAQRDWMESAKNVPDGTATKKNPVHHFKSYGMIQSMPLMKPYQFAGPLRINCILFFALLVFGVYPDR
jgi:hypothetical protein